MTYIFPNKCVNWPHFYEFVAFWIYVIAFLKLLFTLFNPYGLGRRPSAVNGCTGISQFYQESGMRCVMGPGYKAFVYRAKYTLYFDTVRAYIAE